MSKKKILRAKEKEIAKAGRLMFDALFGEDGELEKNLEAETSDDERDSTARGAPQVIDAVGHTLLRCEACGRELVLVGSIDVAIAQAHGWRSHEDKWTCGSCERKRG